MSIRINYDPSFFQKVPYHERNEIKQTIENSIKEYHATKAEIESLAIECVSGLSNQQALSDALSNQGALKRFWGNLTGKNRSLQETINKSAAHTQYAQQQILTQLMKQYASSLEFTAMLNHRQCQINLQFNKQLSHNMQCIRSICEKIVIQQKRIDQFDEEFNRVLFQCPKCRSEVHRRAIVCANCGHIIQTNIPKFRTENATHIFTSELNLLSQAIHSLDRGLNPGNRHTFDRAIQLDQIRNALRQLNLPNDFFREANALCEDTKNQINNCRIDIAVVGTVKAGKSTLINALIGREVAIADPNPETSILTKYQSTGKFGFLRVTFYSKEEWNEIFQRICENPSYHEKFLKLCTPDDLEQWVGRKNVYQGKLSFTDVKNAIKYYTSSSHKLHFFVKELEAGIPGGLFPRDVRLVDTPGLNDFIKIRSAVTEQYLHSADVILACMKVTEINNNHEVQFLSRLLEFKRWDKLFLLATNIDKEPPASVEKIIREYTNNILRRMMRPREYGMYALTAALIRSHPHFIPISAQLYCAALAITDDGFCPSNMEPYEDSLYHARFYPIEYALQNIDAVKNTSAIPVLCQGLHDGIFRKIRKDKTNKKDTIYTNFRDQLHMLINHHLHILKEKQQILDANDLELHEARQEIVAVTQKIEEVNRALSKLNDVSKGV